VNFCSHVLFLHDYTVTYCSLVAQWFILYKYAVTLELLGHNDLSFGFVIMAYLVLGCLLP